MEQGGTAVGAAVFAGPAQQQADQSPKLGKEGRSPGVNLPLAHPTGFLFVQVLEHFKFSLRIFCDLRIILRVDSTWLIFVYCFYSCLKKGKEEKKSCLI